MLTRMRLRLAPHRSLGYPPPPPWEPIGPTGDPVNTWSRGLQVQVGHNNLASKWLPESRNMLQQQLWHWHKTPQGL